MSSSQRSSARRRKSAPSACGRWRSSTNGSSIRTSPGSSRYDNNAADDLVRTELRRRDPALIERLGFDTESQAVVTSGNEADVMRIVQLIGAIAERRP